MLVVNIMLLLGIFFFFYNKHVTFAKKKVTKIKKIIIHLGEREFAPTCQQQLPLKGRIVNINSLFSFIHSFCEFLHEPTVG